MTRKASIIQLSEFDVNQKIVEALSNVCTRAILFSVRTKTKDASQIAGELGLSLSTVYKILAHLERLALVEVDRYVATDKKKIKMYRSRIGRVEITMTGAEPVLNLYPNTDV